MNLRGKISCDFLNSLLKKLYLCREITKIQLVEGIKGIKGRKGHKRENSPASLTPQLHKAYVPFKPFLSPLRSESVSFVAERSPWEVLSPLRYESGKAERSLRNFSNK